MKPISFLLLALICALSACNGQQKSNAKKMSDGIQALRKEHTPGSIPTSATGYYMRCKIDGKDWVATSMMPLKVDDRVLGYTEAGDYIGIPGITNNIRQGFKLTLGKSYNADLYIQNDKSLIDKNGDVILLDKESGKVEITKRDGDWVEGTFYFTAGSSKYDKKIQVTGGVFRVR
ncbi:MAG: hypothetical protein JWR09_206 [Mucilaginibacter sp.]|nr:hypothetical protein [Mucilaginibacter sp.]